MTTFSHEIITVRREWKMKKERNKEKKIEKYLKVLIHSHKPENTPIERERVKGREME